MMFFDMREAIHLTDLSFIEHCNEEYGINRGIYNTIDNWFYEQGVKNLLERRDTIISFLEFINGKSESKNNRCKFGNGGLTIKLNEFYFQTFDTADSKSASNL
jgi:riboflavin kinase